MRKCDVEESSASEEAEDQWEDVVDEEAKEWTIDELVLDDPNSAVEIKRECLNLVIVKRIVSPMD
mgnify:CR=1 FL=1